MNDSGSIVRQAGVADIKNLVGLLEILFSIEEDFEFNETLHEKGLEIMIQSRHACVCVAEVRRRIVGMCTGQLTISTAEGGPALLVEDVVIEEASRGRGIGRKLLDEIARWGKEQGVSRLQLLTDKNNSHALEFYKKAGWQTTQLICLRKMLSG